VARSPDLPHLKRLPRRRDAHEGLIARIRDAVRAAAELAALHRVARRERRPVAELVREAVRVTWLREAPSGPVALWDGPFEGTSTDHDAAFDEP